MFALYHGSVSACTFLDLQHSQPPRDIRKHGFVKLGKSINCYVVLKLRGVKFLLFRAFIPVGLNVAFCTCSEVKTESSVKLLVKRWLLSMLIFFKCFLKIRAAAFSFTGYRAYGKNVLDLHSK